MLEARAPGTSTPLYTADKNENYANVHGRRIHRQNVVYLHKVASQREEIPAQAATQRNLKIMQSEICRHKGTFAV
jgi:hypothetical protein